MSLPLRPTGIPPSSHKVKDSRSSIGEIRKSKVIASEPTRYPGADRSVHLCLLTSQLGDGAIDLVPEVLMGKVQIHILGIGPMF